MNFFLPEKPKFADGEPSGAQELRTYRYISAGELNISALTSLDSFPFLEQHTDGNIEFAAGNRLPDLVRS